MPHNDQGPVFALGEAAFGRHTRHAARNAKINTLGSLMPRYLSVRERDVSGNYFREMERYLTQTWAPLHSYAVEHVSRRDVVAVLDDIAEGRGNTTADRAKAELSGFYAWAIERGNCDATPCLHVKKRVNGGGRERVLSEDELAEIWHAVEGEGDYEAIVKLLILTGQRRAEIGDLTWPEIDLAKEEIQLPGTRTKNSRPHNVPLSSLALEILDEVPRRNRRDFLFGEGSRGFQGWSKSNTRLDAKLPDDMEPWTLHDIRRSVVTILNERGIADPHVIEAICNHVSGHKANVAGVYNRSSYGRQKCEALQAWGEHVRKLVD